MKINILEGQLLRNKGHSRKAHGDKSLEETGYELRCFRCRLILMIASERIRLRKMTDKRGGDE